MRTTTVDRSLRRLVTLPVFVVLLAIVAAWLAAGSAWAAPSVVTWDELTIETTEPEPPGPQPEPRPEPQQPQGPGDLTNPGPEAGLAIKVQPDCERTPGFRYQIIPLNQPAALSDYRALWGPAGGGGLLQVHDGQTGFVSSGEGHFTVSGHAVRDEKKYETKRVDVIVKCDDPGEREPDPDKPRPGKPNFTG